MKIYIRNFCFLLIVLLCPHFLYGQKKKSSPVKLTGNFGVYGDFYHMESDTLGAIAPRRPDFLGRVVVNSTLSIKNFSMPISLALANGQFGVVFPNVPPIPNNPLQNFKSQLKNPLNRMGIAPKYKWVQVLLGSQIPQYSELSVGDIAVFGAGINLTPGKFRFSCFAGASQMAVEENLSKNIHGIYSRKIYSAKIGVGDEAKSHIYFIASMMNDDTASLIKKPDSLMPQNGLLSSLDFRINFSKKFYFKGEIAGSAFTRNTLTDEVPNFSPAPPREIFIFKQSSRIDYAAIACIGWDEKNFGIRTTGRYYGDGFVPLGYPFLQTDRFEVTIDPKIMLLKNKFQLSGSVGTRINNLSGIRAATSTQTIGAANLNWQFNDQFSLSGSYSNFGFRNSITNDTFKVEMVTASWSVSPSLNLSRKNSMHIFSLMYSQNTFTDFNTVSGAINNNDAINGVFSYSLSLLKKPFSFSTIISYFENAMPFGKLQTQSANVTLGYKFLQKKLVTNAGLTLADNKFNSASSGFQTMATLGARYTLKKKIQFGLNGFINLFDYKESRPGISYQENLLKTFITYKF